MRKILLLVLFISALQSCTNIQSPATQDRMDAFSLSTTHCTSDFKVFSNYRPKDPITLVFPALPGVIYGSPNDDIVQHITVLPEQPFVLELPHNMGNRAKALLHNSLTIEPSNTKIIRLGTFHLYPEEQKKLGGGGFKNIVTGDAFVLVYFSKPSSLTGTISDQYGHSIFNIKNAKKGWNWIKSTQNKDESYTLTVYEGSSKNIYFCAFPKNIVNT
jgi:hypothetical protein